MLVFQNERCSSGGCHSYYILAFEDSSALMFRSQGPDVSLMRSATVQKNLVWCLCRRTGLDFHELLKWCRSFVHLRYYVFTYRQNPKTKNLICHSTYESGSEST